SIEFFQLFWTLELYDIYIPEKHYNNEILKLKQECEKKEQKLENEKLIKILEKEYEDQKLNYENKILLFKDIKIPIKLNENTHLMYFLRDMILPRIIYSLQDSFYCFKFIEHLINNNILNLNLFEFYNLFIKCIFSLLKIHSTSEC